MTTELLPLVSASDRSTQDATGTTKPRYGAAVRVGRSRKKIVANTVSARISDDLNERLLRQVAKLNCTKTEFVLVAIEMAIDKGERDSKHTPAVVLKAMPVRAPSGAVTMPEGVVFDRWPNG